MACMDLENKELRRENKKLAAVSRIHSSRMSEGFMRCCVMRVCVCLRSKWKNLNKLKESW